MRRLDEVSFADLTPLGECLKRHLGQGRYIHFSKQKQRFGINPQKHHSDPPGVYFYPIDWLWAHEDFHDHQQFATNWPYWFVCDINHSLPGIHLTKITEPEIEALGARNGWLEGYSEYEHWAGGKRGTGQRMWEYLKHLNLRVTDKTSWLKSLRGVNWIEDDNGIIMSGEPSQICVINPRAIRLIETGSQREINQHDWEKPRFWEHALKQIMARLTATHGGTVVWKNKKPKWVVEDADWSFELEFNDSFSSAGLSMNWRTGRATASGRISARVMKDSSMDDVIQMVSDKLEEVKAFDGNDLQFEPQIKLEDAEALFLTFFVDAPKPHVEIANELKTVWMKAERTRGKPPCSTHFMLRVSHDQIAVNCDVKINGNRVLSASQALPNEFAEDVMKSLNVYATQITKFHPTSSHYKRFSEDEWEPFLGWLFTQTGLKAFEKYEAAFTNRRNISDLYGQIDRVFSRLGW